MKRICFELILLCWSVAAASQITIKGVVFDKVTKKPMEGVVITINKQDDVLAYDISKEQGTFSLSVQSTSEGATLSCRMLGYKDEFISVDNTSKSFEIYMTQNNINLKEVVIKSQPISIHEDTLQYSVNAFKSLGDRNIGDVLKKLPGIEVDKTGNISYKGEAINKFYIEGIDLLQNKYSIATNNLPANAVQNIEVIENHQPIKSIKGMVESQQAAINLKLKSSKMTKLIGGVRIGSGYSDELNWLLEIFALQASKKHQSLAMYKTNNTGNNIGVELTDHKATLSDIQDNENNPTNSSLLSPNRLKTLPIEEERYLFNTSHVASLNNLWKTNTDSQLRLNMNYINDRENENSYGISEYYVGGNSLQVVEVNDSKERKNSLDGALTYTDNSKEQYLENALKWKICGDKNLLTTTENNKDISQNYKLPSIQIQNQLNFLKTLGKKIFNINTFLSYIRQPGKLIITDNDGKRSQTVGTSSLYLKTGSYYSWFWGISSIRINGNIEASLNRLNTDLTSGIYTDSLYTKANVNIMNVEIAPLYKLKKDKTVFELEFPLQEQIFKKSNLLEKTNIQSHNFLLVNVRSTLSQEFGPYLSSRLSFRFKQRPGDYTDYLDSYLMKDYRNYYKPNGIIGLQKSRSVSFNLNYRNPIEALFINGGVTYTHKNANKTSFNHFRGIIQEKRDTLLENTTNIWLGQIYIGKRISAIRSNFSFSSSYSSYSAVRIQQGKEYPYQSVIWGETFKINTKFSDIFVLDYQINFIRNSTSINSSGYISKNSLNSLTQKLKSFYTPFTNLELNLQVEHSYNQIAQNSSVNLFFGNLGVSYTLDKVNLELNWNNIFNKKEYRYSMFDELNSYSYIYKLRPMALTLLASFKF